MKDIDDIDHEKIKVNRISTILDEKLTKDPFQIHHEENDQRVFIPMSISLMIKRISWNEINKTADIMLTLIFKVCLRGLDNLLDLDHEPTSEQILEKIKNVEFRLNDEPVSDTINRDVFQELELKMDGDGKNEYLGVTQTCRMIFHEVPVDMDQPSVWDNSQSLFPIDETTLTINFDFIPIKTCVYKDPKTNLFRQYDKEKEVSRVELKKKKDKNQVQKICQTFEFRQHLLESKNVSDMLNVKMNTIDHLESHNFYHNQNGFNQIIQGKNKISYQIKIIRDPMDIIKVAIGPLLLLMLISIATTTFGPPSSQLANLLAVQLAYGQFIVVFNDKTLDSKIQSIADYVNLIGIIINIIQFLTIMQYAVSDLKNSQLETCQLRFDRDEGQDCNRLQDSNILVLSLFLGTLAQVLSWLQVQYQVKLKIVLKKDDAIKSGSKEFKRLTDSLKFLSKSKWKLWEDRLKDIKNMDQIKDIRRKFKSQRKFEEIKKHEEYNCGEPLNLAQQFIWPKQQQFNEVRNLKSKKHQVDSEQKDYIDDKNNDKDDKLQKLNKLKDNLTNDEEVNKNLQTQIDELNDDIRKIDRDLDQKVKLQNREMEEQKRIIQIKQEWEYVLLQDMLTWREDDLGHYSYMPRILAAMTFIISVIIMSLTYLGY